MIPIPVKQSELLKTGKGNFSLYFPRMVSWLENENKMKDPEAIVNLGRDSAVRLEGSSGQLESVHAKQTKLLSSQLAMGIPVFEFRAKLASPYISGLGSGHPTETGMILDRNTGLPFIPASGIKGAVRLAHALDIAKDNPEAVSKKEDGQYEVSDKEPSMRKYFGDTETGPGSVRGQLVFLDAFPERVPQLKTDIMNPHFGNYYNSKTPPLETESPVPIKFLSVKEGTVFVFRCFVSPLSQPVKADDLQRAWNGSDSISVEAMYRRALVSLGLGAKTAVGYGRFKEFENSAQKIADESKKASEAAEKQKESARLAALSPDEREQESYKKVSGNEINPLIAHSLADETLTPDFFLWLKEELIKRKQWSVDGNPDKDKTVKRCLAVEARIAKDKR